MGTFAATNRVDAIVSVTPNINVGFEGADSGKNSYGGNFRAVRCTLTGSASYATGGDTLPDVGLKQVSALLVLPNLGAAATNTDGNSLDYQTSGANLGKVIVRSGGTNTEVTAATNLSGASWEVLILGR